MILTRLIIWPTAALSYATVFVALVHWLTNTWSGAASLGLGFSVFIGVPGLFGYAGSIWYRNRMHGLERIEAIVGFAFPVFLLALAGLVLAFGRH